MKKTTIFELCASALMAALVSVLGPIAFPIGPVPVSLTILPLLISVWLLGLRGSLAATGLYLLLGAFGLPVFSGYQGGFHKLAGPTGGYLIGFLFMVLIAGFFMKLFRHKLLPSIAGCVLGVLAAYLFGTVWFMILMHCGLAYALSACVLPFIPFDLAKIALSALIGIPVRNALKKAALLPSIERSPHGRDEAPEKE